MKYMKAVILAGGLGTRISEETNITPKPLIKIGGMPLLWHLMKIYSTYDINDFVICCGYKGYLIKEYFVNYSLHMSDVTIDIKNNNVQIHKSTAEPWKITLVDTGLTTMTGGRLKRIKPYLDQDESFCFTYGDGLSDINVNELINFHKTKGNLATVTAVKTPGRFGVLTIYDEKVTGFVEKPSDDGRWINGGFFVLEPQVLNYIKNDSIIWEKEPLEQLALDGELNVFKHTGFWCAMDTLKDKNNLEKLWKLKKAPWKKWQ